MGFSDLIVDRSERFAIGVDDDSGMFYLSISVRNTTVEYDEYYQVSESDFNLFKRDLSAALEFVKLCRARQVDHLLMFKPGRERGYPT